MLLRMVGLCGWYVAIILHRLLRYLKLSGNATMQSYNTGSTDSSIMHYAENYVFTLTDNERLYHVLNVVFIFPRFTGFKTCFNVLFFLRF